LTSPRSGEIRRDAVDIEAGWLATLDDHTIPAGITLHRELRFGGQLALESRPLPPGLINLLDNAIQAIATRLATDRTARKTVIVRSEAAGPYFQLSVIDTGPGIPEPTLAKIFEPLFTTKSFGVGLACRWCGRSCSSWRLDRCDERCGQGNGGLDPHPPDRATAGKGRVMTAHSHPGRTCGAS